MLRDVHFMMKKKGLSLEPFITEHLILRELTMDDISDIFRLYSNQQVMKFDQGEPFKDKQEAEELIRTFKQSNDSHSSVSWGIELKEIHKIIGTCGFRKWDRLSHHAEIGGNISSEYWGNHYGTEVLQFLLAYGFNKMHLNKIYAYSNVNNQSVLALMGKYGFKQEGRLHEHQRLDSGFEDVFIFSLLKKNATFI